MSLKGKRILLGVCGSIAAYKSAFLTRLLVKAGAEVKVLMTNDAQEFVAPLTFSTLSNHPVHTSFYNEHGAVWNSHVEMGLWADAFIIAPCTGNTIAKLARGQSDSLLTATYTSARCPVYVAPAMDLDMWKHPSTQRNVDQLKEDGVRVIPVGFGELASGLSGEGRMAEPEDIVAFLEYSMGMDAASVGGHALAGKEVVVSAGPTYEAIDPVRFIGNHSSGRMGIEVAKAAARSGAQVKLVLGPSSLAAEYPGVEIFRVKSAQDMFDTIMQFQSSADVVVKAAAVSDYTPLDPSDVKVKKKDGDLSIALKRTTDILKTLGEQKRPGQLLVGFALETNNEMEFAQKKLEKKNLDFIVLNSLQDKGAGFKHNTNKVTFIDRNNKVEEKELKSKREVAEDIIDKINELLKA